MMKRQQAYELVPHPQYGFLQVKPTPTSEQIKKFYMDEFYANNPNFNDSSLEVQVRDKEWYDFCRNRVFSNIQEILGQSLCEKSILDVGCGWGEALSFFKSKGMDCYGFDPAPEAVAYGQKRGLNIVEAGIETMNVFSRPFNVVTFFNVLEHLADPVLALQEVYQYVLEPGGVLVVDVPNEFNAFQLAGRDTHGLHDWWVAPYGHLNYFSKDTLCNLISGLGYRVKLAESSFPIEIFLLFGDKYVGNPELGRICHEKRMNFEMNLTKYGSGEILSRFYRSLAELNLGRQVTVYAIKE